MFPVNTILPLVFPVYTTFRGVEVDRILGEALGVDQKVRVGKLQTRKWGQASREERAINLRQVFKTGKKQMLFVPEARHHTQCLKYIFF